MRTKPGTIYSTAGLFSLGQGAGRVGGQVQELSSCLKPLLHGSIKFSASVLLSSCSSHELVSASGSCSNLKKNKSSSPLHLCLLHPASNIPFPQ